MQAGAYPDDLEIAAAETVDRTLQDVAPFAVDPAHLADVAREMTFGDECGEHILCDQGRVPIGKLLCRDERMQRPSAAR